ncbi:MAG: T9SS type A sorting domain-containing protein [Saprospiraceae bacterium]
MNKLMVLFVMTTYVLNCVAQKNALYEFKFYFEDAAGYKDTILYRADTSIVDNLNRPDDDLNLEWGEFIDDSPFDSIFEVRAKSKFEILGSFYQNIILGVRDQGLACNAPDPLLIFVYTKNWPVTMTWDPKKFNNQPCLNGSVVSPDADYEKKWRFSDPVPIGPIACLSNDTSYTRDLRFIPLLKKFELPILIQHDVTGLGKIDITALGIDFGPPYFKLCNTLIGTNDLKSNEFFIQSTIVENELTIFTTIVDVKSYTIFDLQGIVTLKNKFNESTHKINVESLKNGIYFLQSKSLNGKPMNQKFVKI